MLSVIGTIGPASTIGDEMNENRDVSYDDGLIACDASGLVIKRYYPWGPKRVPFASIKAVDELPLTGPNKIRRWRLWGSGDFVHWWNFDPRRIHKKMALVIDVGHRVRP